MIKERTGVAILGSGNIGTDLIFKIRRNPNLEIKLVAGIDPASEGLALARELGYATSTDGIIAVLEAQDAKIIFDATSARTHRQHAPMLEKAGKIAIDLTPAKIGPSVVPCVNMDGDLTARNVNLISCGAQATIPIVHAISKCVPVKYAEIAATVAAKSAGPGTRQNIDEFTRTTAAGLIEVGGAGSSKAIIVMNPAEPPIVMRNTVYVIASDDVDMAEVRSSVQQKVEAVRKYVPGYELTIAPFMDGDHIVVGIEVTGAGDYLPKYAGNLDIITAAATAVAEKYHHMFKSASLFDL